jgi:hypothetical protein
VVVLPWPAMAPVWAIRSAPINGCSGVALIATEVSSRLPGLETADTGRWVESWAGARRYFAGQVHPVRSGGLPYAGARLRASFASLSAEADGSAGHDLMEVDDGERQ